MYDQGFFNLSLHVVPARGALFEKRNLLFSGKHSKNMPFRGLYRSKCSKNKGEKSTIVPFHWSSLPFFDYTVRMPLFSRISPDDFQYQKKLDWILAFLNLACLVSVLYQILGILAFRSIRPEVLCKKGVLGNVQNLQENICARVSFLIKLRAEACKDTSENTFS